MASKSASTRSPERAIARFQNLPAMLAPKFIKLQLLRIDVLSAYSRIVWADAAFAMDVMFARRVASHFDEASVDMMLLEHPFREPPTIAAEIEASLHAQVRLATLERPRSGFRWKAMPPAAPSGPPRPTLTPSKNNYLVDRLTFV